ncbi:hypothetical protein DFJ58DRAFT_780134 [Suillus subalutaceus]|uniref:uncharacterized protein n=1 Tax=Suillus subalutaceus TaxID=48586 RepID=UPI001B87D775|nr:uncharacterized protein DFJ58DRAFT_780134 [Suillus subalutaceus]KAG1859551.1 hypothetical protein DFJ58DRAFT_780134 [Suillus subalutaceus]
MKVRCSPAKQHQFFESLIACMDSDMPVHLRHAAIRLAHSATLSEDDPDRFFHPGRDECYLKLIFALARNSSWHPHLFGDHHIDRCISMIAKCHFMQHTFYLAGILLRIAPGQLSVTSLDSITEQQWWDMISGAWMHAPFIIDDICCFEFLPVLVEGTKRYMQTTSEHYLEWLVRSVDHVLNVLEKRDSEQGEGECVVAVKELRTVASDMLEKLVNSKEAVSP